MAGKVGRCLIWGDQRSHIKPERPSFRARAHLPFICFLAVAVFSQKASVAVYSIPKFPSFEQQFNVARFPSSSHLSLFLPLTFTSTHPRYPLRWCYVCGRIPTVSPRFLPAFFFEAGIVGERELECKVPCTAGKAWPVLRSAAIRHQSFVVLQP